VISAFADLTMLHGPLPPRDQRHAPRRLLFWARNLSAGSFHHQHRALSELHDAIRPTANHSFVQRRMACRPDNEQLNLEIACKLDNVAHRAREQVGMKFYLAEAERHDGPGSATKHAARTVLPYSVTLKPNSSITA
jgi:hypothetical protein